MADERAGSNSLEKKMASLLETLKQVSYQNEMMLRWVNGAVVVVDREGLVTQANKAALDALGWTLEEFIGRHKHGTIHHSQDDGSEYPWDYCPVFAAIEDGSSHHVDGDVFWHKNGSSFSADFIVCPTRDERNEITGAVLTFRNLTEQRLKEANRIHSMKLESIGELSAGLAHEINTPIQFIGSNVYFLQTSFQDLLQLIEAYGKLRDALKGSSGFTELLSEIQELEKDADIEYLQDEAPKAFEQTLAGVDRVTKLILSLKGFVHSGEGEAKQFIDLNEVIRNSLIVCHNAYKHVATMETNFGEIPQINGYPGDIGQVIVNLVVNAAHAIADKKGEGSELGRITISTSCQGKFMTIAIADTGGGIPEGLRQRVFDPFFTTKAVGRGSGQGLAISRTIIHDKHQGDLSFESSVGVGTTFYVRLPV